MELFSWYVLHWWAWIKEGSERVKSMISFNLCWELCLFLDSSWLRRCVIHWYRPSFFVWGGFISKFLFFAYVNPIFCSALFKMHRWNSWKWIKYATGLECLCRLVFGWIIAGYRISRVFWSFNSCVSYTHHPYFRYDLCHYCFFRQHRAGKIECSKRFWLFQEKPYRFMKVLGMPQILRGWMIKLMFLL